MTMSAHDPKFDMTAEAVEAQIDRIAAQAYDTVMHRLFGAVRDAVRSEVAAELADQKAELRAKAVQIGRLEQARLSPQPAPHDLVLAVASLVAAVTTLEQTRYTPGERAARERVEQATLDLRTAYRTFKDEQRRAAPQTSPIEGSLS